MPKARVTMGFAVAEGPLLDRDRHHVRGPRRRPRQAFAAGAMTLKPGEPAGQQAVADTQKRLYGLGVFRSAEVSFEPAPQTATRRPGTVPVNMKVSLEEARRFQLRYGVQLSNEYGPVFDDFTSAHRRGRRHPRPQLPRPRLRPRRERPAREEPAEPARPVLAAAPARSAAADELVFDDPIGNRYVRPVHYVHRQRARHHVRAATAAAASHGRVVGLFLQLARRACSRSRPTKRRRSSGARSPRSMARSSTTSATSRSTHRAAGSSRRTCSGAWRRSDRTINYFRVLLRQFYYKPAGPFVFASGVRWGWLHGISGTPPITIIDQFFDAGGGQTVRGYAEDSLSAVIIPIPPVGGTEVPVGGTQTAPAEPRGPLPAVLEVVPGRGRSSTPATRLRPATSLKLDQLAVGAGFGIRVMTPIRADSNRRRLPARPAAARSRLPFLLLDRADLLESCYAELCADHIATSFPR